MKYNLEDTKELMTSMDYQDRFKAEYIQLQVRIDGLENMLYKYKNNELTFVPKCSYELLYGQYEAMKQYMNYLKNRAQIEDIKLVYNKRKNKKKENNYEL